MKLQLFILCASVLASAATAKDNVVKSDFDFAQKQLKVAVKAVDSVRKSLNQESKPVATQLISPRTIENGKLKLVRPRDWTSGFFPGTLWYAYEYTGDKELAAAATEYTELLESLKDVTSTHDLGFMVYCSYGNGNRLTDSPKYKDIIVQASKSLCTRFNPTVGLIRSWDHNTDKWQYPVIIDNMMNLEMLFWASKVTGDDSFKKIAISHADKTMKNHFRDDYSTYHVVSYDPKTGAVEKKNTHQGYSDDSAWARGQAWGLYGYTLMYRETGDKKYLTQAENIAKFIFADKNMPADLIPYWDYNDPKIPNVSRDVSAAAVTAAALYELSTYNKAKSKQYLAWADKIVDSISKDYMAPYGQSYGFLTLHSTGHRPAGSEVDAPINYADYYFLEALIRKDRLAKGEPVIKVKY